MKLHIGDRLVIFPHDGERIEGILQEEDENGFLYIMTEREIGGSLKRRPYIVHPFGWNYLRIKEKADDVEES